MATITNQPHSYQKRKKKENICRDRRGSNTKTDTIDTCQRKVNKKRNSLTTGH